MKKYFNCLLYALVSVITLILFFWLFRLFSAKQLDDVSPEIKCDKSLLEKADILYIIPKFNNKSISENLEWCNYILSLNKTLGLHGVYHTYEEFNLDRSRAYLQEGINEFEKCFEKKPERFKAPQMAISINNKKLVKDFMKLDFYANELIHKVYHCSDTGIYPNKIIKII